MFQTSGIRMMIANSTNPGIRYSQNPPLPRPRPLWGRRDSSACLFLTRSGRTNGTVATAAPRIVESMTGCRGGFHAAPARALLGDGVDAGLVLAAQFGENGLRRLGAVDELLQAGVQLVVEGRRGPVGVEADAVLPGEGVEVVDQLLALRVGDRGGIGRDGDAAAVAHEVLDLLAHRDVDELVGQILVLRLGRDDPDVARGTRCHLRAGEEERAPVEARRLRGESVVPPAAGVEDRVLAADPARARVFGLEAGRILADVALVDPVLDGVRSEGELRAGPVDLALVELVVIDPGAVGLAQGELVEQLAERVLCGGFGKRCHAVLLEGLERRLEL